MQKAFALLASVAVALVGFHGSAAKATEKIYRIGYLQGSPDFSTQRVKAFRRGLHENGYVEGKNIVVEWRHTNRRRDIFPQIVKKMGRLKLDCIVTVGLAATRAAKDFAPSIPVVMADSDGDPIRYGLIDSYSRPGSNVTGVTSFAAGLSGKRLQFLKESFPRLSRIMALVKARAEGAAAHIPHLAKAANTLGLAFHSMEIRGDRDIEKAFRQASKWKVDAMVVVTSGGMQGHRGSLIKLAAQHRMPVMYSSTAWVRRGGLMSYRSNIIKIRRRAADFVAKILKGANPATLPVELPTKFDLTINLKTAKVIGVTFPQSILIHANKIIE